MLSDAASPPDAMRADPEALGAKVQSNQTEDVIVGLSLNLQDLRTFPGPMVVACIDMRLNLSYFKKVRL